MPSCMYHSISLEQAVDKSFDTSDEVIFGDAPSTNEENGEFPSRCYLAKGHVEIASFVLRRFDAKGI